MNEQYKIFKSSNKNIKSKSRKFIDFYKCNVKSDLLLNSKKTEQSHKKADSISNSDVFSLAKRSQIKSRSETVKTTNRPEKMQSVKTNELIALKHQNAEPNEDNYSNVSQIFF